ncbi:hypothetical protein SAMN05661093_10072 [Kibdelosporangium aridum]|uniref:Cytochrome P450 n=2 Tax=Kibdelosporangium aridum TaxID=2030 RepID=A0A1W2FX09_KIBAR|nr:hypothetical protein SAMN05661093_10072 [Kibdelosporangium aridum]
MALRRAVVPPLAPKNPAELSRRLQKVTTQLLAGLDTSRPIDFVREVGIPLPALTIGAMLELPEHAVMLLRTWAEAVVAPLRPETERARDTMSGMQRIIGEVAGIPHSSSGTSSIVADIIRRLQHEPLSTDHTNALLFYLLFVWYEVLSDAISGGLLALLDHPEEMAAIKADSTRCPGAIEELLRYTSPQMLAGPRFAVTDFNIGNARIRRGQCVLLSLAAAR